jgi:hypothetical protein
MTKPIKAPPTTEATNNTNPGSPDCAASTSAVPGQASERRNGLLSSLANRTSHLQSYADIDDGGGSSAGGQDKSKRKRRADKREQTEPCRCCGVDIKFRGPQPIARNLDGTPHRCLSGAHKAKKYIRPVSKKRLEEMKAHYRELMLMRSK